MADKNIGQQEGSGGRAEEVADNQESSRTVDRKNDDMQTGSGQAATRQGGQGGQQRAHDGKGSGQSSRAPGRNS